MAAAPVLPAIEHEVIRIRELSRSGQNREALVVAESLYEQHSSHRDLVYLIAANQRCLNRIPKALATLDALESHHPQYSLLYQERGHCLSATGDLPGAVRAFAKAVEINPALVASWTMLATLYASVGDSRNAAIARQQLAVLKDLPEEVVRAGSLYSDGDLVGAEKIVRGFLLRNGDHAEGMRLLARIQLRCRVLDEAEFLLEETLKHAPDYRAARLEYVQVLIRRQKYPQALAEAESLLELEPENATCLLFSATALAGLGRIEAAISVYRKLLVSSPQSPELHVVLGHSLKAAGLRQDAIASYRAAALARPDFGDAWWSLANLKTWRFSDEEIALMRAAESASVTQTPDRVALCFALGKALEDQEEYEPSWSYYIKGNALKRGASLYHPDVSETNTLRQMEVCSAAFFAERAGYGLPDEGPIFIVGLPRSGSTLIEQILASQSQVEATQELGDVPRIVLELQGNSSSRPEDSAYPGILADLQTEEFRRLGDRYLHDTVPYRTGKPHFIDKMPNNFRHIGLIHLMLPNARIIDVRREPMACCFSNFKQLFAEGQEFTYSIEDIASYYRTYLELMRHWHAVLPGRVLHVSYEEVVDDLEGQVRRILDFCRLGFESSCLEFYKTKRNVRTPSSEQVRQAIFRESLDQWRKYERWLAPLKDALGDALIGYRV
jgi:tetratricopeptide (TPR) repeat protein